MLNRGTVVNAGVVSLFFGNRKPNEKEQAEHQDSDDVRDDAADGESQGRPGMAVVKSLLRVSASQDERDDAKHDTRLVIARPNPAVPATLSKP